MQYQHLDPLFVAAFRHGGQHLPEATDSTWERLILWASPRRLLGRNLEVKGVGLLWDDPRSVAPHGRRYDVGIPIDREDIDDIEEPAIVLLTMPGDYVRIRHTGPYDQLPRAYEQALGLPMQAAKLELVAAPILELYRNSPSEVAPDDLVTDLYFPVVQL